MLITVTKFNSLGCGFEEVPPSLQPKYGFRSLAPQRHALKYVPPPPPYPSTILVSFLEKNVTFIDVSKKP